MPRPFTASANAKVSLIAFSVCAVACSSKALKSRPADASASGGNQGSGGVRGSGGTGPAPGGVSGSGGASQGSGGVKGSGGLSVIATGGDLGSGGAQGGSGGIPGPEAGIIDAAIADAIVADVRDTSNLGSEGRPGEDTGNAESGGWDGALADFCTGDATKVAYKGKTFSPPVTTKETDPAASCCAVSAVHLHTTDAVGVDLEVIVSIMGGRADAGTYSVNGGNTPIATALRTSKTVADAGATKDATVTGSVVISGGASGGSDPWQVELCVVVSDSASKYNGMQIYVPGVSVAPAGWSTQLRIWPLKDSSLSSRDVNGTDVQAVELAAQPLMELRDTDFVDLDRAINNNSGFDTCMWVGLNTAFYTGSKLLSQVGQPTGFPVDLDGVPFVLEADGERIYMGAFTTSYSSFSISGPEVFGEDIVYNGFPIYPPMGWVGPGPVVDLRADPRIVKVLTEAGKAIP